MSEGTDLSYNVAEKGGAVIVQLDGIIDSTHSSMLTHFLKGVRDKYGAKDLILDMTGIVQIDSSGLGILVAERSRTVKSGKDFRVCSLSDPVRKIFRMAHLDRLFELYDSVEDALNA